MVGVGGRPHLVDLTRDIVLLADEDRYVPPITFNGDEPNPCSMAANRVSHLADQLADFMSARSGNTFSKSDAAKVRWFFFSITIDARLYAPLLHLAREEIILPETFDTWTALAGSSWNAMRQSLGVTSKVNERTTRGLKTIYRRYREEHPAAPAAVYFYKEDHPGSWLIEYWFYYPFDEGGLDEHLHDSEHLFVEVDKLGGIVRRVVGAGHGDWAPNNEYGTFKFGVREIELPLWAISEQGKHATAPDVDKDLQLTPGIDTNLYRDVGKVWGIRDATGQTDSALRPFGAAMMTARRPEDHLQPLVRVSTSTTVDGTDEDEQKTEACPDSRTVTHDHEGLRLLPRPTCYLLHPLHPLKGTPKCDGPTAICASTMILQDGDFERPWHVLKQGFFPAVFPRMSHVRIPTDDGDTARSTRLVNLLGIGGGAEISAIPIWPGKRLPLPGRIAIQGLMKPGANGWIDGITGHYELLLTNLFNAYVGLTWLTDDTDQRPHALPPDAEEQNRTTWLTLGGGFERPIVGRLSGITQIGVTFNNFYGLRYEFSAGLALSFRNNHRRFGIERRAKNPFSH